MIVIIRRLLDFSGRQRGKLILSFVFSLLDSVFAILPVLAILTVLNGVLDTLYGGTVPAYTVWGSLGIMVLAFWDAFCLAASLHKRTLQF